MANSDDTTRFADLKTRFAAIGHQVFEAQGEHGPDRYFVARDDCSKLVGLSMTLEALADFCTDCEEDAENEPAVDRVRSTQEPRWVQIWRGELSADIDRLGTVLDGLRARVGALDRERAPIDDPTRENLLTLERQLNSIIGGARYEGVDYEDDPAAAASNESPAPIDEPTMSDRRAEILKTGDAAQAINHVKGTLWAIHGQARMLQQDALRDEHDWVLSIAHMIVEEAERMTEFLDRRGGWAKVGAS